MNRQTDIADGANNPKKGIAHIVTFTCTIKHLCHPVTGGNKGKTLGKGKQMVPRKLLNVKEVSGYTGLAPDTIYKMVSQRRIPFTKVGKLVKFDHATLDAWLKQHTIMPMPPKRHGM
jgi:excisionase family DNA binding protein